MKNKSLPKIGSYIYEQGYDGDNFKMKVLKHYKSKSILVKDLSQNGLIKKVSIWTTKPIPGFGA